MERKLALWVGVPFLGVAWTLIAFVAFAPGLINGRLLMVLLLALSVTGILILLIRIAVRERANTALPDTLYPIAGILVAIGIGFHEEVGAFVRGVFDYVMLEPSLSEGVKFSRAEDGQFHIKLMVEGAAVDFMAEPSSRFNVLMPDVPQHIGLNPSSLIYNQRIEIADGDAEYAADMVLRKVQLGTTVIEDLPVKVFATDRGGNNILGKPFFDGLKHWRIDGNTLIVVR
jgi:clan AA aspartic protease (TIGR02281 family)